MPSTSHPEQSRVRGNSSSDEVDDAGARARHARGAARRAGAVGADRRVPAARLVLDVRLRVPAARDGGLSHAGDRRGNPQNGARLGRRVGGVVTIIMLAIIYAGVVHHINPPSNIETVDPKTLHLTGEFTEGNLGTSVDAAGQVTSRMVATQFAFQPQCIARSGEPSRDPAVREPRRDPRHPGHGHERQHDGRAGLCQPGAHGLHQDRRPADALPRILRPRAQPDVGDGAGRRRRPSSSRTPTGGRPVTHARRLTLAHMWVAFAAFAVASVLGVWQMWARSPLPAPFLTAEDLFHLGDGARRRRWPMCCPPSSSWASATTSPRRARAPAPVQELGLARLRARRHRRRRWRRSPSSRAGRPSSSPSTRR